MEFCGIFNNVNNYKLQMKTGQIEADKFKNKFLK